MLFPKIGILGVGLLGGSAGLAIQRLGLAQCVEGYVRRSEAVSECEKIGVAHRISTDLESVVSGADLIIVCTPVEHMRPLLDPVQGSIKKGCILTDVGSVKAPVLQALEPLADAVGAHFVGSHPMAGGERVGVGRARSDLFEKAVCAVTPSPATQANALERVQQFWKSLGMQILLLDAGEHDRLVSRASHLPHVTAAALTRTVLNPDCPTEQRQLCAGGFRDSTRIASGPVPMWEGILSANHHNLASDIDALIRELETIRGALQSNDTAAIRDFLASAHDRREEWLKNRS